MTGCLDDCFVAKTVKPIVDKIQPFCDIRSYFGKDLNEMDHVFWIQHIARPKTVYGLLKTWKRKSAEFSIKATAVLREVVGQVSVKVQIRNETGSFLAELEKTHNWVHVQIILLV